MLNNSTIKMTMPFIATPTQQLLSSRQNFRIDLKIGMLLF